VILPFKGSWQEENIPVIGRAYAAGVKLIDAVAMTDNFQGQLYNISPDNVRVSGCRPDDNTVILNEMCGKDTEYFLELQGKNYSGKIKAYEILEINLEK